MESVSELRLLNELVWKSSSEGRAWLLSVCLTMVGCTKLHNHGGLIPVRWANSFSQHELAGREENTCWPLRVGGTEMRRCVVSFSAMVESWEDRRRQVRGTAANELEGVYFNEVVIYSWLVSKAWCRMETSYVVPENLQKVPCLRWSPNPRVRFPGCFLTTLWHEVLGYIKTLCFL